MIKLPKIYRYRIIFKGGKVYKGFANRRSSLLLHLNQDKDKGSPQGRYGLTSKDIVSIEKWNQSKHRWEKLKWEGKYG